MTPKQAAFVREYLIDLNATQSAIRAGYSESTASEQGSRLLGNVKVAEAIAQAKDERADKCDIDALWVLREAKATYEAARSLDKLSEANTALGLIGKHVNVNAFEERIATKLSGSVATEIRLVGPDAG